MPVEWLYSILAVLLVSLVSLVGVFTISISEIRLKGATFVLVSLAAGGLFGDALIHLLPEAWVRRYEHWNRADAAIASIGMRRKHMVSKRKVNCC